MMPPSINAESASVVGSRRLFICAEGFEPRTLEWITREGSSIVFDRSFILRYSPRKPESLYTKLLPRVKKVTTRDCVTPHCFHRFEPVLFEWEFGPLFIDSLNKIDCLVIDISVMSKLMIVMLLTMLKDYRHCVRLIYSEPANYAPTQEEYEKHREEWSQFYAQPTFGVHGVIRTPMLSSVTMQRCPTVLISFASFNEQLIPSLLTACNPSNLIIINGRPPRLHWREKATQEIVSPLIREYRNDNPLDDEGNMLRSTSTLDYRETFKLLSEIYHENAYSNRLIIAPTGSKMQAVACALFKICCPDVHVEYPTPESFFARGFSSEKTVAIHELRFESFHDEILNLSKSFGLDFS